MNWHEARCAFECSVRGVDDPTERRMLQEVLLDGRQTLTGDEVEAHFQRNLRTAADGAVRSKPVDDALSDGGRKSVLDTLKAAAHPVAFASGLEILAPFH